MQVEATGQQLLEQLLGRWGLLRELGILQGLFLQARPWLDTFAAGLFDRLLGGRALTDLPPYELTTLAQTSLLAACQPGKPVPILMLSVVSIQSHKSCRKPQLLARQLCEHPEVHTRCKCRTDIASPTNMHSMVMKFVIWGLVCLVVSEADIVSLHIDHWMSSCRTSVFLSGSLQWWLRCSSSSWTLDSWPEQANLPRRTSLGRSFQITVRKYPALCLLTSLALDECTLECLLFIGSPKCRRRCKAGSFHATIDVLLPCSPMLSRSQSPPCP